MSDLNRAKKYEKRAKNAKDNLNFKTASEYYFEASKYYGYANEKFWQKYCEEGLS